MEGQFCITNSGCGCRVVAAWNLRLMLHVVGSGALQWLISYNFNLLTANQLRKKVLQVGLQSLVQERWVEDSTFLPRNQM